MNVKQTGWIQRRVNSAFHLMLGGQNPQVNDQDQIVQSGDYCYTSLGWRLLMRLKYSYRDITMTLTLSLSHPLSFVLSSFSLSLSIYLSLFMVHSISFQTAFVQAFKIVIDTWKFSMLLLYILWDDWPIFYDLRFKSTATARIRIHPTKAGLSQLVDFKNAIWTWGHFRRTICNKMLF